MIREDKVSLAHRRAELVTRLTEILSTEDRVRIQGELSLINAKIKALNTTEAAQLKARADQRKVAGLAQAQANAARAQIRTRATLPQDDPRTSPKSATMRISDKPPRSRRGSTPCCYDTTSTSPGPKPARSTSTPLLRK